MSENSDCDILEGFCWHSCIGLDSSLEGNMRFTTRMPNNIQARSLFWATGNNHLIHKTTNCLWKLSDDKKSIIPEFNSDVLSAEDVQIAMEGSV